MNHEERELTLAPDQRRLLWALIGIGGTTFFGGLLVEPQRIWANFLLASTFVLGLALAGIFFVALEYVTGASWSVAFRRIPEAMARLLPLGAVGVGLVLMARPSLYAWTEAPRQGAEALIGFKRAWLNYPFFLSRSAVYLLSWLALAYAIVRNSQKQDEDGDLSHTRKNVALSAVFMVVFAFTFWLASFDWIMSLEPHWYSTIFGIYNFAGLFLGGLAAIILLLVWCRKARILGDAVRENHLFDLGRLLFAFSTFWAYIWFSQYMLIWYANIPEETTYFIRRSHGAWRPLFFLNLILNWVIPFLVLLPSRAKRSTSVLVRVSIVVLLGRWLDLYLMILPSVGGAKPSFGVWEIGLISGAVALFLWLFVRAMQNAPPVPTKDPRLTQSLQEYH